MLNAYLLTRLTVVHDLFAMLLSICIIYWMLRGAFKLLMSLDGFDMPDLIESIGFKLRKLHHIAVALTLLSFFGSTLLPSRSDIIVMAGTEAASQVSAVVKQK